MLTDTQTLNMRNVLHQIYVNLYVEFGTVLNWNTNGSTLTCGVVVKNPLSPVEHPGGEGVANELFELALDQFVKGVLLWARIPCLVDYEVGLGKSKIYVLRYTSKRLAVDLGI